MGNPENFDLARPVSVAPFCATTTIDNERGIIDVEKLQETKETLAETSLKSLSLDGERSEGETVEEQAASTAKAGGINEDDDLEYPKATKLAFITIALMLSVRQKCIKPVPNNNAIF